VRGAAIVFTAATNVTFPLAVPLAPLVMVTQDALLVAVQAQPLVVVTEDDLDPPAAATECDVGDTTQAHGTANENVFDCALRPTPPGPTAATVAT
jgi:hypothetical protein